MARLDELHDVCCIVKITQGGCPAFVLLDDPLSYQIERKFNLVISTQTLEHIPHPEQLGQKLREWSDRCVVVSVPFRWKECENIGQHRLVLTVTVTKI